MYGLFGDITQVQADVNSGLASWGKSFHFWLDFPKICLIPVPQLPMFHVVFSTQILCVMVDFTLFANSWD